MCFRVEVAGHGPSCVHERGEQRQHNAACHIYRIPSEVARNAPAPNDPFRTSALLFRKYNFEEDTCNTEEWLTLGKKKWRKFRTL